MCHWYGAAHIQLWTVLRMTPLLSQIASIQEKGQPNILSAQDYQILFPLTRNTNYNNIRAAGDNVTTEAYLEAPSDCQYGAAVSTASVGASSRYMLFHFSDTASCCHSSKDRLNLWSSSMSFSASTSCHISTLLHSGIRKDTFWATTTKVAPSHSLWLSSAHEHGSYGLLIDRWKYVQSWPFSRFLLEWDCHHPNLWSMCCWHQQQRPLTI